MRSPWSHGWLSRKPRRQPLDDERRSVGTLLWSFESVLSHHTLSDIYRPHVTRSYKCWFYSPIVLTDICCIHCLIFWTSNPTASIYAAGHGAPHHPPRGMHMQRGEFIAFNYLHIFLDAINMLEEDLKTITRGGLAAGENQSLCVERTLLHKLL